MKQQIEKLGTTHTRQLELLYRFSGILEYILENTNKEGDIDRIDINSLQPIK
ncbi:MAG: hypothetical protein HWN81_11985 [Candidatus Lokiarchaeota archaeon]|nr:hypothetical protein [Candidatus Lokiarchaeota archaeon]